VTSCLFLTSKTCIVTWHPVCTLRPNRAFLRDILSVPYVQIVHCYVTSCLFLTSKTCIVTWHPVCTLRPNRAFLRDILSVPYVQIVCFYVASCLYLTSKSCVFTWHPVCSLRPKRALLRDILSRICHKLTFNVVTIRHAQPAPYSASGTQTTTADNCLIDRTLHYRQRISSKLWLNKTPHRPPPFLPSLNTLHNNFLTHKITKEPPPCAQVSNKFNQLISFRDTSASPTTPSFLPTRRKHLDFLQKHKLLSL